MLNQYPINKSSVESGSYGKNSQGKINRISYDLLDSLAPTRGPQRPPYDIKEGVISDPMLLYSIYLLVYLEVTCKISDRNLKI